ncbi:MAG TPA: 50S ribosomal protein L23 [bacterium]|jgi:large subunit ribosomal protein L23|nr:50S ribosomal protein L23 [bacterium]HOG38087.1 50S ribosomal protein L23 [bacterium]HQI03143.1 50S ribosomal protein L23 [bacterium]
MGIFSKKKKKIDKKEVVKQTKDLTIDEISKDKSKKTDKKEKVKKSEDLTIEEIKQEKSKKLGKGKKVESGKDTKESYKILVRALITEKASYLKSENKYLFEVTKTATKNEIKKAIFHVYGCWPESINIINIGGKRVRYGKNAGTTKGKKKAIVTLKKGDSIEIYEGV